MANCPSHHHRRRRPGMMIVPRCTDNIREVHIPRHPRPRTNPSRQPSHSQPPREYITASNGHVDISLGSKGKPEPGKNEPNQNPGFAEKNRTECEPDCKIVQEPEPTQ